MTCSFKLNESTFGTSSIKVGELILHGLNLNLYFWYYTQVTIVWCWNLKFASNPLIWCDQMQRQRRTPNQSQLSRLRLNEGNPEGLLMLVAIGPKLFNRTLLKKISISAKSCTYGKALKWVAWKYYISILHLMIISNLPYGIIIFILNQLFAF